MPSDEEFAALEGRIAELENRLRIRRDQAAVTREEYETYVKVHNALAGRSSSADIYAGACFVCGGMRPCVGVCFACGGLHPCVGVCRPGQPAELVLGLDPDANPVDEGGADRFDG